ncbi:hypothetical protein B0H19DRAFT_1076994 [Mycena capillaripes]|nr:hypothetical protein B0H19DRAFT_1076994 [Mycena capillaripes]
MAWSKSCGWNCPAVWRCLQGLRRVGVFCWGSINGDMKDDGTVGVLYTAVLDVKWRLGDICSNVGFSVLVNRRNTHRSRENPKNREEGFVIHDLEQAHFSEFIPLFKGALRLLRLDQNRTKGLLNQHDRTAFGTSGLLASMRLPQILQGTPFLVMIAAPSKVKLARKSFNWQRSKNASTIKEVVPNAADTAHLWLDVFGEAAQAASEFIRVGEGARRNKKEFWERTIKTCKDGHMGSADLEFGPRRRREIYAGGNF